MKEKCFDFIIPGFPKSGTSSLHEYLNLHSKICMSAVKEPHIYSKLENYQKRYDNTFDRSLSNLIEKKDDKTILFGESSTSYMITKESPKRIFEDNPNTKFIIIARDPIDRIVSHYNWLLSNGENLKPFKDEIESDLKVDFDINKPSRTGYKSYIEHSKYGDQIENFLKYFPVENFLFISLEKLKLSPQIELDKCFVFLGVEKITISKNVSSNKTNFSNREITKYNLVNSLKKFLPNKLKHLLKERVMSGMITTKPYSPTADEVNWLYNQLQIDVGKFKELSCDNFDEWCNFANK